MDTVIIGKQKMITNTLKIKTYEKERRRSNKEGC